MTADKVFISFSEWKRYYFPKLSKKERALKLLKLPKEYTNYISDSLVDLIIKK